MKGCVEQNCIDSISFDNYFIQTIMMRLHALAIDIDNITSECETSGRLTGE